MVNTRTSAGGVVISSSGRILVTNQNNDSWSLPKGGIEPGEDELEAAKREIDEETGVEELVHIKKLGEYKRHRIGKGGVGEDKSWLVTINMHLFKTTQQKLDPKDPANPEAIWVDIDKVGGILTHQKDKEFYLSKIDEIKAAADQVVSQNEQ